MHIKVNKLLSRHKGQVGECKNILYSCGLCVFWFIYKVQVHINIMDSNIRDDTVMNRFRLMN